MSFFVRSSSTAPLHVAPILTPPPPPPLPPGGPGARWVLPANPSALTRGEQDAYESGLFAHIFPVLIAVLEKVPESTREITPQDLKSALGNIPYPKRGHDAAATRAMYNDLEVMSGVKFDNVLKHMVREVLSAVAARDENGRSEKFAERMQQGRDFFPGFMADEFARVAAEVLQLNPLLTTATFLSDCVAPMRAGFETMATHFVVKTGEIARDLQLQLEKETYAWKELATLSTTCLQIAKKTPSEREKLHGVGFVLGHSERRLVNDAYTASNVDDECGPFMKRVGVRGLIGRIDVMRALPDAESRVKYQRCLASEKAPRSQVEACQQNRPQWKWACPNQDGRTAVKTKKGPTTPDVVYIEALRGDVKTWIDDWKKNRNNPLLASSDAASVGQAAQHVADVASRVQELAQVREDVSVTQRAREVADVAEQAATLCKENVSSCLRERDIVVAKNTQLLTVLSKLHEMLPEFANDVALTEDGGVDGFNDVFMDKDELYAKIELLSTDIRRLLNQYS
jgi:hypothetical protein